MLFPPKKFSLPAAITQNTTVALICFFLSAALCFDGGRVLDALVHAMEWALLASSVSYLLILLLISRRNFCFPFRPTLRKIRPDRDGSHLVLHSGGAFV